MADKDLFGSRAAGKKGGKARANVLTKEQRSAIARDAARARWAKAGKPAPPDPEAVAKQPEAKAEPEMPYSMFQGFLEIGDVKLECHVLNDSRRVFTQREVVKAISGGRTSGDLKVYVERNPLMDKDSFAAAAIAFRIPKNPTPARGSEATLLVELCEAYLQARDQKKLRPSQIPLAKQAEIILRACAKVGIIALIDEATGFQKVRARRALQVKLQAFIADEIQEWARMFPEEFWIELARLESVHYSPRSRPLRWGRYVMMFVYDAIDGDVGRELRKKNPNPRFLRNHHQWLRQFGRDRVHDQITRVVTIMKLCSDMDEFRKKFARVFKKTAIDGQLTFDDLDWGIAAPVAKD